ncbi:hypothetical protein THASP1DRAFT_33067 [Thamnocephalis sphaerospora]|uniref:CobW C-terminal domain-containing protein n=1 Tax=Thamnocephalis sphaerospora TaxID=78915 RepID=A0A4P9XIS5_9FUNG|nr:hypothetical protein THASP1DRAFT_33067 [Thamnocephalis sphaerospora]|eukprot:RKP05100.1 hypothetical protein THASP1DRAFT_33067 [Thamnocephalis sphaerospora]
MADRILLNKVDLMTDAEVGQIETRLRTINAAADIYRSERSKVPVDFVLDLQAYTSAPAVPTTLASGAGHLQNVSTVCIEFSSDPSSRAHLQADEATDDPVDPLGARIERWIQLLLWENQVPIATTDGISTPTASSTEPGPEVLRLKGVFRTAADPVDQVRIVQAVQELYEVRSVSATATSAAPASSEGGKLVLIGRRLDANALLRSFIACVRVSATAK